MTSTAHVPNTARPVPDPHVVKVSGSTISGSTIAAARAQVAISRRLGRPVSKAVEKIAAVR